MKKIIILFSVLLISAPIWAGFAGGYYQMTDNAAVRAISSWRDLGIPEWTVINEGYPVTAYFTLKTDVLTSCREDGVSQYVGANVSTHEWSKQQPANMFSQSIVPDWYEEGGELKYIYSKRDEQSNTVPVGYVYVWFYITIPMGYHGMVSATVTWW